MVLSFEAKFREQYPDCRIEEEFVSQNVTRYHVVLGNGFHCSESAIRELAFKYAWMDVQEGKLKLPPQIEQMNLWPIHNH